MNRKISLVFTSCLIGLITATAYAVKIQHIRNEITGLTEKVTVLVALRDIKPGESFAQEDLATSFLTMNQAPIRAVAPDDINLIVGRKAFHPIPAGETILWTDLPEGPRIRKPSENIPHGYRAISLPADETHTMVHFISPGDSVDIISSSFIEGTGMIGSRLIAEDITILSVGQRFEEWSQQEFGEGYPMSVTILVSPKEALKIMESAQSGEINFLARGSHLLPIFSGDKDLSD